MADNPQQVLVRLADDSEVLVDLFPSGEVDVMVRASAGDVWRPLESAGGSFRTVAGSVA